MVAVGPIAWSGLAILAELAVAAVVCQRKPESYRSWPYPIHALLLRKAIFPELFGQSSREINRKTTLNAHACNGIAMTFKHRVAFEKTVQYGSPRFRQVNIRRFALDIKREDGAPIRQSRHCPRNGI